MGMVFTQDYTVNTISALSRPASGIGADQIAFFLMKLNAAEAEILETVGQTKHIIQEVAKQCPDVLDQASKEEEAAMELMAHSRNKQALRDIRCAIERIQVGDYGFCADCGIEIEIRRLMASPTSAECFDCKTIQETKGRAFAQRYI